MTSQESQVGKPAGRQNHAKSCTTSTQDALPWCEKCIEIHHRLSWCFDRKQGNSILAEWDAHRDTEHPSDKHTPR